MWNEKHKKALFSAIQNHNVHNLSGGEIKRGRQVVASYVTCNIISMAVWLARCAFNFRFAANETDKKLWTSFSEIKFCKRKKNRFEPCVLSKSVVLWNCIFSPFHNKRGRSLSSVALLSKWRIQSYEWN
jgi:hypothetical protein